MNQKQRNTHETHSSHCLNEKGKRITHLTTSDRSIGLSSQFITSIFEDSMHRIWVTTEGGEVCYAEQGLDRHDREQPASRSSSTSPLPSL